MGSHKPPSLSITTTLILILSLSLPTKAIQSNFPLIVNTWSGPFTDATDAAYFALEDSYPSLDHVLDGVQAGCQACQNNQCGSTVGFGGSPDESCETTLDALIMDGQDLNVGAVANLRRVKDAVGVARRVLEYTQHSLLAGDQATQFALENGFEEESLSTEDSLRACREWRSNSCQPNYRSRYLVPDPSSSCGPYSPMSYSYPFKDDGFTDDIPRPKSIPVTTSQDTLSLVAVSWAGVMASCTTTNGAAHKIPGRVGDGPIPGSGTYVDSRVGGCGATGDGDIMMRLLPCYQAVESLRRGMTPQEAADDAVRRIIARYPEAKTGIVVVSRFGEHAAAASGWDFTYSYRGGDMKSAEVVAVKPLNGENDRDTRWFGFQRPSWSW
ncbi:asparaginase-like protein [Trichoderma barbatum]